MEAVAAIGLHWNSTSDSAPEEPGETVKNLLKHFFKPAFHFLF